MNENKDKLTLEQELFTRVYTREGETFGNATLSYAEAYNFDLENLSDQREKDKNDQDIQGTSERERAYQYCSMAGSRLMRNDKIKEAIRALKVRLFEDDKAIDARVADIIFTGKDTDALNAIKHRNDLKQRITKKIELNNINRPLVSKSDEELLAMLEEDK